MRRVGALPPNLLRGEDLPARPRQRRSAEKREHIEKVAIALFGRKGFDATSVDDIAAAAGVATGGVYLHFRSKRQLLLTLMNNFLEELSHVSFELPTGGSPRQVITTLLRNAFRTDAKYLGAYRAWRELALVDGSIRRLDRAIHRWTQARVERVFERLHAFPAARPEVDVRTLSIAMDRFYWTVLGEVLMEPGSGTDPWIETAAALTYHALFRDE